MKFLFILQYTFFDKTTFPKSVKASALSVCLPFVPRCLQTFKVFVFLSYLVVFKRLNCFNPLLFIIPSPVLFQPLLATCGSQDYLLVNRLNFKCFSFSSVVIVRCLPEPALLIIELFSLNLFKSL